MPKHNDHQKKPKEKKILPNNEAAFTPNPANSNTSFDFSKDWSFSLPVKITSPEELNFTSFDSLYPSEYSRRSLTNAIEQKVVEQLPEIIKTQYPTIIKEAIDKYLKEKNNAQGIEDQVNVHLKKSEIRGLEMIGVIGGLISFSSLTVQVFGRVTQINTIAGLITLLVIIHLLFLVWFHTLLTHHFISGDVGFWKKWGFSVLSSFFLFSLGALNLFYLGTNKPLNQTEWSDETQSRIDSSVKDVLNEYLLDERIPGTQKIEQIQKELEILQEPDGREAVIPAQK